jgi:hypothetical protein
MGNGIVEAFAKQLEQERVENTRRLARLRTLFVALFFVMHLFMGWGLHKVSFQGKELVFSLYLSVSVLLWIVSERRRMFRGFFTHGIALIDVPFCFFVLAKWAGEMTGVARTCSGLLILPFMMFWIHMTGFYYSTRHSLLSAALAVVATIVLEYQAGIPPDSKPVCESEKR